MTDPYHEKKRFFQSKEGVKHTAMVMCTGVDSDLNKPTLNGILRATCKIWTGHIENYQFCEI